MKKFFDFLFPPLCLHCTEKTEQKLFCKGCAGFFELIDPRNRCPYCFLQHEGRSICLECKTKKRWHLKTASALDYLEAVSSFIKKLKYGRMPYLAETGGQFLIAQFFRLEWPIPDLIIPVPRRNGFQQINHAYLLAYHFAKNLKVACKPMIKRKMGDLSQARLSKHERESLSSTHFYLKKNSQIEDKVILLVDDVMTTGTTLRHCARALDTGYPSKIYAITLARSNAAILC